MRSSATHGFTLLEVLLVLCIFALLSPSFFTGALQSLRTLTDFQTRFTEESERLFLYSTLYKDIQTHQGFIVKSPVSFSLYHPEETITYTLNKGLLGRQILPGPKQYLTQSLKISELTYLPDRLILTFSTPCMPLSFYL